MKREDISQLSRVLIATARLLSEPVDLFFSQKLEEQMIFLVQMCLSPKGKDNVAQYKYLRNVRETCMRLSDLFEFALHKHGYQATPLLKAYRELLAFQYVMLKNPPSQIYDREHAKEDKTPRASVPKNKTSKPRQVAELKGNHKKILQFIQAYPNARTRDIIDECHSLSSRSVKRYLKELMQAGLVTKRSDHGAVFYSAGPSHS